MSAQQPEKQKRWRVLWIAFLVVVLLGFMITIIGGYAFSWTWTGFGDNKLWEWLNLLILPVTLALGANLVSMQQNRRGLQESQAQHQADLQIAEDTRQEGTLDAYIDQMMQLLLEKNLRASRPGSDIREGARIHTLTALRRLNPTRQRLLLQFLDEAGLINQDNSILNLSEIDLSGIQLSRTNSNGERAIDPAATIIANGCEFSPFSPKDEPHRKGVPSSAAAARQFTTSDGSCRSENELLRAVGRREEDLIPGEKT